MDNQKTPTKTCFLDLFAGIGGFSLGAQFAGLRLDEHYFSEVDTYAIKVYKRRFPDAIELGSICDIKGGDLPRGDWIIAGGFPCQDISVAGKGAGLAGERSGLWYEYARLIGELRPRYAIMENVGALTFRGLDAVLGSLAEIGYDAEWQDIRASDVGAPHRRERLWIVAYPELRGISKRWGITDISEDVKKQIGIRRDDQPGLQEQKRTTLADADETQRPRDGSAEPDEQEHRAAGRPGWWATEPDVGRVAYGVPARVDRLKCLGNSIVPQIAELIFLQPAFDEWRHP